MRPKNDLLLRAAFREPVERTPVWMMRQAGRYLPEYRAVREKAGSFLALCKNPELAAEVTLQPVEILGADAAILFSDILVVPEAMGQGLAFAEGEGPVLSPPVRSAEDLKRLSVPDPEADLGYVMAAVDEILRRLNGRVPLIGFSGSPWTLATYMIEGGSSKTFAATKRMLFDDPVTLHTLLEMLAEAVAAYLNAQIRHGVHAVQIFDTWGGILAPPYFEAFSLAYIRRVIESIERERDGERIPVIVFVKGGAQWLEAIAACGCDVVGLDWTIDLAEARARVGDRVALQGNMDPGALYAHPRRIREEVLRVLHSFGRGSGHIFNLGHGIAPDVPKAHAIAMFEAVRELSPAFH